MAKGSDITGMRFGRLIAVRFVGYDPKFRIAKFLCQCDCGNTIETHRRSLLSGGCKSCGCLHKESAALQGTANTKDLTGCIFGKLTVLSKGEGSNKYGSTRWIVKCECGVVTEAFAGQLQSGKTKSCGCLVAQSANSRLESYRSSLGVADPTKPLGDANKIDRDRLRELHAAVKQRDNYTCLLCGVRGGILHTHHVFEFWKNKTLRFSSRYMVTLCRDCHLNKAHPGNTRLLDVEVQQKLLDILAQLYEGQLENAGQGQEFTQTRSA